MEATGQVWRVLGVLIYITAGSARKVNVALNKPASTTSGFYPAWTPDKAVDGNRDQDMRGGSCFHSDWTVNQRTTWTVDLGQLYQLQDVTIYNRNIERDRINNCVISASNSNSSLYEAECYIFPPSNRDFVFHLNPTCPGRWRYVTIWKDYDSKAGINNVLNICEVEIYACSQGTYGVNCDLSCHCLNASCNRTSGRCPGDCSPGWKGDVCNTECVEPEYGISCMNNCTDRRCVESASSCESVTGSCDTGCLPGFKGVDCTQGCIQDEEYGADCAQKCQDRRCSGSSSCDSISGACDDGCEAGWTGDNCSTACESGVGYGKNCAKMCSDRHCRGTSSCNRMDGSCDTGCQERWTGSDCTVCTPGLYGADCRDTCGRCKDSPSCDQVSGACPDECVAGYSMPLCRVCVDGIYGPTCNRTCGQCVSAEACDKQTGICLTGCSAGFTGFQCVIPEPDAAVSNADVNPAVAGVIGAVVSIVVMLGVAVAVFVVWRKRTRDLTKTAATESTYDNPTEVANNSGKDNSLPLQQSVYDGLDAGSRVLEKNTTYSELQMSSPYENTR